jgi:hypothetical protein
MREIPIAQNTYSYQYLLVIDFFGSIANMNSKSKINS